MDMSWGGLRSLRAVAQHGTVAAAAASQGYTPGAVSQQLAALERAAGRPLLERVGRGVRLTEAGRVLVEHADHILRAERQARAALESVDEDVAGTVTIATFATFAASLLASAIVAVEARHPQIEVRTLEVEPDDVASAVDRGDADIAFGLDYPDAPVPQAPGIEVVPVLVERFAIGAAPGALTKSDGKLQLAELTDARWVMPPEDTAYGHAVFAACRRAGFEPQVAHVVTDTAASLAMAAQGLGVLPVTELMLELLPGARLDHHPLAEDLRRDVVLLRRAGTGQRPAVAAVTDVVEELVVGAADASG